jgi:hypothetical protein
VIEKGNPFAPPRASLDAAPAHEYWREGKVLAMRIGSVLPPRCVKCNEPAVEPSKSRRYYWHHPAWFLLVLINLLLYMIVAVIVRKKAVVAPGLCAAHRMRRIVLLWVAWIGFVGGMAGIYVGTAQDVGAALAAGAGLLLVALIVALFASRLLYPARITKEEVRLKGCGAPFLDSLEGE